MILVDTSVWVDHFRAAEPQLVALLSQTQALTHPCVIGEIALGGLKQRAQILRDLGNLPMAQIASHAELMAFIDARRLASTGVSYVDACLLAATTLTPGAVLWSRDKALKTQASRLGIAAARS